MSSSEHAVIHLIHVNRKDPGTTGDLCHCRSWQLCPDLRILEVFQLEEKCQLRCLGLKPGTQLHSSCPHFPFAFSWINYSSCCSLDSALLLCMLESCHIPPLNLAVFKGWINCSLRLQFGTGVCGPLCVLRLLLFKIAVCYWYLSRILQYFKKHTIRNRPLWWVG